jgi:hypothetical protein
MVGPLQFCLLDCSATPIPTPMSALLECHLKSSIDKDCPSNDVFAADNLLINTNVKLDSDRIFRINMPPGQYRLLVGIGDFDNEDDVKEWFNRYVCNPEFNMR